MPSLRRPALAVLLVVCVLVSGCDFSRLEFVKDHRLHFTHPDDYDKVTLPLEVTWTMKDFTVLPRASKVAPTQDAGYFAVFVDRAPVRPGHTLADVGKGDVLCESNPRCPDAAYLATKGVYTTHTPSLTLSVVAPLASKEHVQLHQITVVLLDSTGHRIGEYAWYEQFRLDNQDADE